LVEDRFDSLILNMTTRDQFSNLFSFIERGGWYSADTFLDWARRKLNEGTFTNHRRRMADLTLVDFYEQTGKDLTLIAADTSDQRLLVLNHHTAPDVPVVWAMRMSMSVPLLWQEVIWQYEWGLYMNRDLTGHCVVDGGLLSNFPIELFLSNDPYIHQQMGPKSKAEVLGFLIDESLPVPEARSTPDENAPADLSILPVTSRIKSLVDTTTQARDKMVIDAFEQYVCRLPAMGYGTTEFNMSDKRRDILIRAGRRATEMYFEAAQLEGMLTPDIREMERALSHADQIARNIFKP
jgi:predicted acylesterase/phospholipase RssA